MRFKVTLYPDNSDRTFIIDETNHDNRYFIGLDGRLYENYGTKEAPMWEETFDADYKIELNK